MEEKELNKIAKNAKAKNVAKMKNNKKRRSNPLNKGLRAFLTFKTAKDGIMHEKIYKLNSIVFIQSPNNTHCRQAYQPVCRSRA